jgi:hypothetical protein
MTISLGTSALLSRRRLKLEGTWSSLIEPRNGMPSRPQANIGWKRSGLTLTHLNRLRQLRAGV